MCLYICRFLWLVTLEPSAIQKRSLTFFTQIVIFPSIFLPFCWNGNKYGCHTIQWWWLREWLEINYHFEPSIILKGEIYSPESRPHLMENQKLCLNRQLTLFFFSSSSLLLLLMLLLPVAVLALAGLHTMASDSYGMRDLVANSKSIHLAKSNKYILSFFWFLYFKYLHFTEFFVILFLLDFRKIEIWKSIIIYSLLGVKLWLWI